MSGRMTLAITAGSGVVISLMAPALPLQAAAGGGIPDSARMAALRRAVAAVQYSRPAGEAGSIVSGLAVTGGAGLGAILGTFVGSHAGGRTIYRAQAQEID